MDEHTQANFAGWAILEIFGHQTYAGYVTTEAYGQAVMFRVDVPELPARERVAEKSGYASKFCRWLSAGDTVQEEASPGYSKLFGAGAIYSLTPCSEEAARLAVDNVQPRKLKVIEVPKAAIAAPDEDGDAEQVLTNDESDSDDYDVFGQRRRQ